MYSLLAFIAGLVLLGLLLPKSASTTPAKEEVWQRGVSFAVFVIVLAASPIIGALFAIDIGVEFSPRVALCFSWIGIAAALPLSLLVARLFGTHSYAAYWSYLETSAKIPRRKFLLIWFTISIVAFVLGMLAFALSVGT
ncbi:MAG: hypothetical protein AMXMBFR37_03510 [Steroidobacteraceae bacterium]